MQHPSPRVVHVAIRYEDVYLECARYTTTDTEEVRAIEHYWPILLTDRSAALSRRGRPLSLSKDFLTAEPVRRESRITRSIVRRLVLVTFAMAALNDIRTDIVTHY
jgi:hypothetical protein